jgi:hypothetical protein
MDACLMSMPEVGYQMRDDVAFTVGIRGNRTAGWMALRGILRQLAKTPNMTGGVLGQRVVEQYLASYKGKGEAVTQSLSDLSQAPALSDALKVLATSLKNAVGNPAVRSAIRDARDRVQSYTVLDNVDLADLCTLIKTGAVSAAIKTACDGVLAALGSSLSPPATSGRRCAIPKAPRFTSPPFPFRRSTRGWIL